MHTHTLSSNRNITYALLANILVYDPLHLPLVLACTERVCSAHFRNMRNLEIAHIPKMRGTCIYLGWDGW